MENTMAYPRRKMSHEETLELMKEDYEEMEREAVEYLLSQKKRVEEKEMENTMVYPRRKMSHEEILELMKEDYEEMEREAVEYLLSQKKRGEEKEVA